MDELERLKNTVESIRAMVLDAEEKQEAQNHAVRNWVSRLNNVLHPADDLLDEFVIHDMRHKMDEAHHDIEKIQKQISDVMKDMSGLNLNTSVVVVEQTNNV